MREAAWIIVPKSRATGKLIQGLGETIQKFPISVWGFCRLQGLGFEVFRLYI